MGCVTSAQDLGRRCARSLSDRQPPEATDRLTPIPQAHAQSGHDHHAHHQATAEAVVDVPMQAREAVATVDRFFAALGRGDIEAAGSELASDVSVFENGRVERSAAEYLAGHAAHDAAFIQEAHHQPKHRIARISGDLVWVASESEFHANRDEGMLTVFSNETMVLRRSGARWEIVHIHWSNRQQHD
jgi:ketosteroid isomerase-like protein